MATFTFMVLFDPATTDWRADRAGLTREIRRAWPDAEIDPSMVTWTFRDEEGPVESSLHSDGSGVHVDGQLESAVRVAAWFRRMVPPSVDLIFCDIGYNVAVSVPVGAQPSDILSAW